MTNTSPVDIWCIPDCDDAPWMTVFDDDQTLEGLSEFCGGMLRQLIHPDPLLRVIIYDQKEAKRRNCTINPHILKHVNLKLYGPVIMCRVVVDENLKTEEFVNIEQSIKDDWPKVMECIVSYKQS